MNPTCPAFASHGAMVLIDEANDLYYCYDCRLGQWHRKAYLLLDRLYRMTLEDKRAA